MYLEIYADSLLLLHFFLNLYMLALVNCMLYYAAPCKRLLAGAGLGALCAIIPVLLPLNFLYGGAIGFLLSVCIMCRFVFKVHSVKQWRAVLEKMFLSTLLLGGLVMLMIKLIPGSYRFAGTLAVLVAGAFATLAVSRMLGSKSEKNMECTVVFVEGAEEVRIKALMDTGNTLVEPISKRPVAIAEEETMKRLFAGTFPEGFRLIPYHSVGKQHGILKGYYLERLIVEMEGVRKVCRNIYVATCSELVVREGESMVILSPMMLKKEGKE